MRRGSARSGASRDVVARIIQRCAFVACALLLLPAGAAADENEAVWRQVQVGGRFEYRLLLDRDAVPFPWNATSQAFEDHTRLMLDLKALGTRYGSLYLKGAAVFDDADQVGAQKRFRFEQGDYLWEQQLESFAYHTRAFANERRYFIHDQVAPLISDETAGRTGDNVGGRAGRTGDNGGLRADVLIADRVEVNAIASVLGDDLDRSRRIAYARGAYSGGAWMFSASYLFDDHRASGPQNQVSAKAELSAAYKYAYAVLSYAQTEIRDGGVFLPGGRFNWDRLGDGASAVLPDGAALTAEARVRRIPVGAGDVKLVYRYETLGQGYVADLSEGAAPARVRHLAGAYFNARGVSLHGRLRYRHQNRRVYESAKSDVFDAGAWATLKDGLELRVRGAVGETRDDFVFDTKSNFVHVSLAQQKSRFRAAAHVMWKDLDTPFSDRLYAWDGKLALAPNWGLYWRFTIGREFKLTDAVYGRIDYRPSNRIYLTAAYGRAILGDGPFLVEDRDLDPISPSSAVYTISVRGDF